MTEAERRLRRTLRAHRLDGLSFRRQAAIGRSIADFACPAHKLIVELDGSQHGQDSASRYDARRTADLEAGGYRVVRSWNDDVLRDLDGVCAHIPSVLGRA